MDQMFRRLLSDKDEVVWPLPSWMLGEDDLEKLREEPSLGIIEIAGKDSIAAGVLAARKGLFSGFLPTIAYTGTQYGDWDVPFLAVERLKERVAPSVHVYPPVLLGAPSLWRELCGGGGARWLEEFGIISPCIACHLYFHLLRMPLALHLRAAGIIAGERVSHDGRIKLSQVDVALELFHDLFSRFGAELVMPLKEIQDSREIEALLGGTYREGERQLRCVLSGNYVDGRGNVSVDREKILAFLEGVAVPLGERWLRERFLPAGENV